MKPGYFLLIILVISAQLFSKVAYGDTTLVKFGSSWKFLDNNSTPANWQTTAFNDAAWSSGTGEFGYGDNDERTIINYGGNPNSKYITTYFRKSITIANISVFGTMRLNMYLDDGAVIYVNGIEVARNNMPAGGITGSTLASSSAAEDGNNIITVDIASSLFVSGNNVIAAEVHQDAITSSDISFDFELIGKPSGVTVFNYGTTWKYLDNGSNQGTAWTGTGFNDASWASGAAELGYGDAPVTPVSYGPDVNNKYVTTYFRKTINISNPSSYSIFNANIRRDDGCIVYVNGTQVYISNLSGTVAYNTYATNAADDGATPQPFSIPSSAFVSGNNVIAVEMHQSSATSSDLTFDMELTASAPGAEPEISRGPLLQMVSTNAITIRWTTSVASDTKVWFGNSENTLNSSMVNNTPTTDHELRVTGLSPDTKYYYGIGTTTSMIRGSYRNYFITSPPATSNRKIRIGVFGDAGTGTASQKGTRNSYLTLKSAGNNSELALMLGDNAYNDGLESEHQTKFFDIYDNNVFDNHTVFSVPGNHEYANSPGIGGLAGTHAIPYFNIFTLPTAAESGGIASGTEHYYSFDYGNIHFVMLDSYGYDGGKLLYDSTGQQALWLKSDLAANTRKWTIVSLHHPPFTNGTHFSNSEPDLVAIRQQITPILERFGVDVVLAGHSHVYERSFLIQGHTGVSSTFSATPPPTGNLTNGSSARYDGSANSCPYFTVGGLNTHGTVYVVAGSAGQIGGGTNAQFPAFYYRNYSGTSGGEVGILYLEVEDNRLDAKFVGTSGIIRDQFTIMKDVNRKTSVNMVVNTTQLLNASWVGGYNWYTTPAPPITVLGNARTYSITPSAIGNYTYYVRDSISPSTTCMADTFTIQVTASLAVSLLKYTAFQKKETAVLLWSTAYEQDNDYFTIERSLNGRDFQFQMLVNGSHNPRITSSYEYIDNSPAEGINYYRLTQTDKNGRSTVLGTRSVNFRSSHSFKLRIQPNPVLNNQVQLNISSSKKQQVYVYVLDMNGAKVFERTTKVGTGENKIRFQLAGGSYVVSVKSSDGTVVNERLLVK